MTASSALGGAERCLLDIVAQRDAPDAEHHVLAPTGGALLERASALRAKTGVVPMPRALLRLGEADVAGPQRWRHVVRAAPAVARYVFDVRRAVDRAHPTIVHTHGMKPHIVASLALGRGAPVVWHLHDFLRRRESLGHAFRLLPRPAAAIAVSRAVADDARALVRAVPVTIIHNGIDTSTFEPGEGNGAWLDDVAGLSPAPRDTIRVGLVATYARWKGQDVFLEAAARLRRAGSSSAARFYVVGGPIYVTRGSQFTEAELRRLAERMGISDRVGFVAFQANPADVYRALDLVVHASTEPEPFGLTIAEAMSCGRPVILARSAGAAELIDDGQDAIAVAAGSASELAAAMAVLLADPERRSSLGVRARARALEAFARGRMAKAVREVYDRVCFGRNPPISSP